MVKKIMKNYLVKNFLMILFFSLLFFVVVNNIVLAASFQIDVQGTDWEISSDGILKDGLMINCSDIIIGTVPNPEGRNLLVKNSSGTNLTLFTDTDIYAKTITFFASLTYPASISDSFIIKESNDVLLYVDDEGLHYKEGLCILDPECGNGIPEIGEECDDGNTNNNDGCSSECEIESCYGSPSICFGRLQSYCDNGCTWNPSYSCNSNNDLVSSNCSTCGEYWNGSSWVTDCTWYVEGGGGTSFLADTKIDVLNGFELISDIREGSFVKSYDVENGESVFSKVSFVKQGVVDHYYYVNNKIKVTRNHKFYTNNGLLKVENLSIGSLLFDGEKYVPIISLQRIIEKAEVYTLGVEEYNNYFVEGILVHNDHNHDLPTGCYGEGTDESCWNQYISCIGACQSPFSNCVECTSVTRCEGTPLENCDSFGSHGACVNRGCTWGTEE